MKDDFTAEIMETIRVISDYKEKHNDDTEIEQYYESFGTYDGIVEYLTGIVEEKSTLPLSALASPARKKPY